MANSRGFMPKGYASLEWRSFAEVRACDYVEDWLDSPDKRIQQIKKLHDNIKAAGGNSPFEGITFVPQD